MTWMQQHQKGCLSGRVNSSSTEESSCTTDCGLKRRGNGIRGQDGHVIKLLAVSQVIQRQLAQALVSTQKEVSSSCDICIASNVSLVPERVAVHPHQVHTVNVALG